MAAISLSDCELYSNFGEFKETMIKTPATADSADTIDISALISDGLVMDCTGWDVETGIVSTATIDPATNIITIDAAGGTSNHTYAISVKSIGKTFTP